MGQWWATIKSSVRKASHTISLLKTRRKTLQGSHSSESPNSIRNLRFQIICNNNIKSCTDYPSSSDTKVNNPGALVSTIPLPGFYVPSDLGPRWYVKTMEFNNTIRTFESNKSLWNPENNVYIDHSLQRCKTSQSKITGKNWSAPIVFCWEKKTQTLPNKQVTGRLWRRQSKT